jgi:hypothetical protein
VDWPPGRHAVLKLTLWWLECLRIGARRGRRDRAAVDALAAACVIVASLPQSPGLYTGPRIRPPARAATLLYP